MRKTFLYIIALAFCAMNADVVKHDAITSASKSTNGKEQLPPKATTYTVYGWASGIEGYIVKYDSLLYRGGDIKTSNAMNTLKLQGIKTIVSISPSDTERLLCKNSGVSLVELPFAKDSLSISVINGFLSTMDKSQGPVYVHCHSGMHRAGLLCLAYRVHKQKRSPGDAIIEFGKLGGSLKDDDIMISQVLTYHNR